MAFFEAHNIMPENHTFTDLIRAANQLAPLDPGLVDELKALETIQDLCPLYVSTQRNIPDESQLERLYTVTDRVRDYCTAG